MIPVCRSNTKHRGPQKPSVIEAALSVLARGSVTQAELAARLARKGFDDLMVSEALARLEQMGYLDDEEYARRWISLQRSRQPSGRLLLQSQLEQKGVDKSIASRVVMQSVSPEDEMESAKRACMLWIKRAGKGTDPRVMIRKLGAHLAARGFEYDTVRAAIWQATGIDVNCTDA